MSHLHVDSVIKSFGDKQVLTDIFLTCSTGEIIGLLGKNGCGKSTLLKIIFGSIPAERKFVKVDNTVSSTLFRNPYAVKYLPQHSFLPNHVIISTVIGLFCSKKVAQQVSDHKFIRPLLNKKSKQLSGGERRILEILLVVYSDAKFILIDEPFNGVAPVYKDEIKRIIREQSAYKGFIITDHDYRNILDISTKNLLLFDGGIKEVKGLQDLEYWGYKPAVKHGNE